MLPRRVQRPVEVDAAAARVSGEPRGDAAVVHVERGVGGTIALDFAELGDRVLSML